MKISASPRGAALAPVVFLALAAACDNGPTGPEQNADQCTTSVSATQGDGFVELCALTQPVRHVRIENLRAPATHASAQIVFGFDAPPSGPQATLDADQFRVLFYGGGTPAPAALVQANFGAVGAPLDGDASFVNAGGTVCFDLHDGAAGTAPSFVLWVHGQRGANCNDRSTLTAATAYGARSYWPGATGAIDKQAKAYFRQAPGAGTAPTITLFAAPVLDAAAIAAATTCTTTWAANTNWQSLCVPAAGKARHVRIESAQSTTNNAYFYAVLGQDADPTGNPAASTGKLIVTGGRSNSGTSWTWFRFGAGSTPQFSYATDGGSALYTDAPATICFDTGSNGDGTARIVFWATGAKQANCAVRSSLTLDRALYDSANHPETAAIWNGPYVQDKLNFIKTSSAASSLGNIVISSEPAAL